MNGIDKEQLNSILERTRELAIEANKGLGMHQLEEFRRIESERLNLSNDINDFITKTREK